IEAEKRFRTFGFRHRRWRLDAIANQKTIWKHQNELSAIREEIARSDQRLTIPCGTPADFNAGSRKRLEQRKKIKPGSGDVRVPNGRHRIAPPCRDLA